MRFSLHPEFETLIITNNLPTGRQQLTLIDTGASIPVWANAPELLKRVYQDAHYSGVDMYLGGFGGTGGIVPIWSIPSYTLSDGTDSVTIHNLCVAVCELQLSVDMILSLNTLSLGSLKCSKGTVILEFPYKQMYTSLKYTKDGKVKGLRASVYAQSHECTRVIEEIRSDNALYNLADEYGITTMDIYSLLGEVIQGETTLTNEEIMEQIKHLVRSGS